MIVKAMIAAIAILLAAVAGLSWQLSSHHKTIEEQLAIIGSQSAQIEQLRLDANSREVVIKGLSDEIEERNKIAVQIQHEKMAIIDENKSLKKRLREIKRHDKQAKNYTDRIIPDSIISLLKQQSEGDSNANGSNDSNAPSAIYDEYPGGDIAGQYKRRFG